MSGFATVLAKECRDNVRDKRTIIASISLALLGPALFAGLMSFAIHVTLGESRDPVQLAVVGAERAPNLIDHLSRSNVNLQRITLENPRAAVRDGRESLVLVIGPDYRKRYEAGQSASVELIYNSAQHGTARRDFERARQMIGQFASKIGALRLQLRGVYPGILTPVRVTEVDVASPAARAATVLAMLPYLLVLVVFMGGFYLAIDATAGEREHGSLEPLLSQPVSRHELVLGKIAAASLFSALSTALFLVSMSVSVHLLPLHRVGMSLNIGPTTGLAILAVCMPLMVLGAALLTVVASFARTYREAQTYLSIVILVPTLPLVVIQLLDLRPSAALMLVPSLSQATLAASLIKGETLSALHVVISVTATTAVAMLLAWLAVRLYQRERMLI